MKNDTRSTDKLCSSCKFWVRDDDDPDVGDCHRYPPVIYPNGEGVKVGAYDWCGEYKKGKPQ